MNKKELSSNMENADLKTATLHDIEKILHNIDNICNRYNCSNCPLVNILNPNGCIYNVVKLSYEELA